MPICDNCNSFFPNTIVIDNKQRNLKSRRYCLECSPFGMHKTRPIVHENGVILRAYINTERVCKDCGAAFVYTKQANTIDYCQPCYSKNHRTVYNCKLCGESCRKKNSYCKDCFTDSLKIKLSAMTLGDIRELYKDKSSMNVAAKVRGYGATIYRNSDKPKHCVNCGYSKFYEVCHIRAVKDFPGTATMSEVHSLDNLIALCPNCHWEFDHGMLTL